MLGIVTDLSNVKAGDRLVTSGLQSVMPGKPVRIINQVPQGPVNVKKENFFSKIINKIKKIFN